MRSERELLARLSACPLLLALTVLPSNGQITGEKTLGEKVTPLERSKHGDDIAIGEIPKYQVTPQKTKARVLEVDVKARTLKIVPAKKNGSFRVADLDTQGLVWRRVKEMELSFIMPSGREKIRASGQAAKRLGKKGLRLEEIPKDARIKVEYYPVAAAALEVVVQSVP